MALKWRGKELTAKIQRAERSAVNSTMSAAVLHAKQNHLWKSRTGGSGAEGSIRIIDKARSDGRGAVGRWGSKGIVYFRRLEQGFKGEDSAGRKYSGRGHGLGGTNKYPALIPAAKSEYKNLTRLIRAALRTGG